MVGGGRDRRAIALRVVGGCGHSRRAAAAARCAPVGLRREQPQVDPPPLEELVAAVDDRARVGVHDGQGDRRATLVVGSSDSDGQEALVPNGIEVRPTVTNLGMLHMNVPIHFAREINAAQARRALNQDAAIALIWLLASARVPRRIQDS